MKPGFGLRVTVPLALLCVLFTLVSSVQLFAGNERDVYERLARFEYGQSREAVWQLEHLIRTAGDGERKTIEERLQEALRLPGATVAGKESISGLLGLLGSCRSVAVLKAFIADEKLGQAARDALHGRPCPDVDEAFREALPSTRGSVRLGLVSSIGERRDRGAVGLLAGLLSEPDPTLVEAVLSALGRIGGEEAAGILRKTSVPAGLRFARADALLSVARSLASEGRVEAARSIYRELQEQESDAVVRAGAMQGIVGLDGAGGLSRVLDALKSEEIVLRQAAASLVREIPGGELVRRLVDLLPSLPVATQALVVTALGERGDRAALAAVTSLAEATDEAVQMAAVEALGRLGDQNSVDVLFRTSKKRGPVAETALDALRLLPGPGVDQAIARYVKNGEAELRVAALRTLTARRFPEARDYALAAVGDVNSQVRLEAWKSLAVLATPSDLSRLVGLLLKLGPGDREQQSAEQAVQAVAHQVADDAVRFQPILEALRTADPVQRCSLVRTLGRIGGEKGFSVVRRALEDGDATVRDTAVRVLSDWGDETTAGDLLQLARKSESETYRVLALRGYVRLARDPGRDPEERVRMLGEAMGLAARSEEKRLVLGAAGSAGSVAAFALIEPYLADADLGNEAEAAYLRAALAVQIKDPARASAALRRILRTSRNQAIREQAEGALQRMN